MHTVNAAYATISKHSLYVHTVSTVYAYIQSVRTSRMVWRMDLMRVVLVLASPPLLIT